VVPIYNEEENIPLLVETISGALADSRLDYEMILVDDGSSDGSFSLLKGIAEADPQVRVIRFRRSWPEGAGCRPGRFAGHRPSAPRPGPWRRRIRRP
jgi:glycosyltransferase involved in cell wall biosynthesis